MGGLCLSHQIKIIGLGAGDIDQLPLGIYKKLKNAEVKIYVRTVDHPVIQTLIEEGIHFKTFDHYYEQEPQFDRVYERIVERLINEARENPIIYAVPGHPMLAEQTVHMLLDQTDIPINVIGGHSYLDDLFTSLKIDPINGFQFIDGTSFHRHQLNYEQHLIFCQVYDATIASNVKLILLEDLPPDYEVTIIQAAGSAEEEKQIVPLAELDHSLKLSNLTSVYVPPAPKELLNHTFSRLREVIATLRGPSGCDWDRAQTHETLRDYVIEEAYELIDAINDQDDDGIIEELGDILLQVMLHSQIGEDAGYFSVDDVIKTLTHKMIHRHPHVFGKSGQEHKSWDELKQEERDEAPTSILAGIPNQLPSLAAAVKLQEKAAKVGFDWDDINDIWQKLDEELSEVQEAIKAGDEIAMEDEFGDVLFVIANIARFYKINPELALHQGNKKFERRFKYIEEQVVKHEKDIHEVTLEEMDRFWDQAKERE